MFSTSNANMTDIIIDPESRTQYKRECYLGKGGFAKCYQVTDIITHKSYACKIIPKEDLGTKKQKNRTLQEINIHRPLKHKNIVNFHNYFEDSKNIYIILELCNNRSLRELHKRRRTITEYECRYYMFQIIEGIKYLHENKIIHRDIKLGNIFLNDDLNVKIGDFGLAVRLKQETEIRRTLCGTPNFVAPEVLNSQGHSFEADIWSLGCLMYTLLIGKSPFETEEVESTYERIKKGIYYIPKLMEKNAVEMIEAMLQTKPKNRPKIYELLNYKFMTMIAIPTTLPFSCLTIAPRLTAKQLRKCNAMPRNVLAENNIILESTVNKEKSILANKKENLINTIEISYNNLSEFNDLQQKLLNLLKSKPKVLSFNVNIEVSEPAAQPLFWISKWVDDIKMYGFAYEMCTDHIGVKFNDQTNLILFANDIDLQYIDKDGNENFFTTTDYSKTYAEKIKSIFNFKEFMKENLLSTGDNTGRKKSDKISRLPYLNTWLHTDDATVMQFTNGTVQLNFKDHIKLILCPRMNAVTYVNENNQFFTQRFSTIMKNGFSRDLYEKILLAKKCFKKFLTKMY